MLPVAHSERFGLAKIFMIGAIPATIAERGQTGERFLPVSLLLVLFFFFASETSGFSNLYPGLGWGPAMESLEPRRHAIWPCSICRGRIRNIVTCTVFEVRGC